MRFNGRRYVPGKVRVNGSGRVLRKQRDAFGYRAGHGFGGMEDRHGPHSVFDDDFRPGTHVRQQRRDIGCGGFLFRDVDHVFPHV